jgi:hypothetical protein
MKLPTITITLDGKADAQKEMVLRAVDGKYMGVPDSRLSAEELSDMVALSCEALENMTRVKNVPLEHVVQGASTIKDAYLKQPNYFERNGKVVGSYYPTTDQFSSQQQLPSQ